MPSFRKSAPAAGSRPGTLAIPPGSPPPEIHVVSYDADHIDAHPVDDVEALVALLEEASRNGRKLWVDVRGLGDEGVLRRIGEIFDIHPLALEDAVNVPQRAASQLYETHHVLIARMPILDEKGGVDVPQVCFMLGDGVLLTFQERFFRFFEPVRERLRAGIGPIRRLGPDYLAYALIDTLIDRYYPIAQLLSEQIEELEEEVVTRGQPDTLLRLHQVRRRLVILRRIGLPQREALTSLLRDDSPWIDDTVRTYLRNTVDHIAQIMELVESSREMCVGITEIHLSNMSQRTNEVMKVLTLMASIFIPLSFLAGVYGMNFDYIPGLHRPEAFALFLLGMFGIAGGMLTFFYRRGWIGNRKP